MRNGSDHLPAQRPGEAGRVEGGVPAHVRRALEAADRDQDGPRHQPGQAEHVAGGEQPGAQQGRERVRAADRVGQQRPGRRGAPGHHHPGAERLQPQGVHVDDPRQGRVGGVEELEAAVHEDAVDGVRADPAAHAVVGLEDQHVQAAAHELAGAGEPREPGPDHHHVGLRGRGGGGHGGGTGRGPGAGRHGQHRSGRPVDDARGARPVPWWHRGMAGRRSTGAAHDAAGPVLGGRPGPAPGAGDVVAGVRLTSRVGRGSAGTVWSGTEVASGPRVAVKLLDRPSDGREAALLGAVRHPHVLPLRRASTDPPALVTDLAPGGSLADQVAARGTFPPGEVVTLLAPLADALAALHARGVVHGDVSGGNVLFVDRGRPVLADLGVAALLGGGTAWATPGSAAPEVLAGSPPGPAADVHGLGALGWLALTGALPPPEEDRLPLGLLAPGCPAGLLDAVTAALRTRPATAARAGGPRPGRARRLPRARPAAGAGGGPRGPPRRGRHLPGP